MPLPDENIAAAKDALASGSPLMAIAHGVIAIAKHLSVIREDVRELRRAARR